MHWVEARAGYRQGATEDQQAAGVPGIHHTVQRRVKANLEVVNRQAHSIQIAYVAGGLDATIIRER
jgi:hypothetical protein